MGLLSDSETSENLTAKAEADLKLPETGQRGLLEKCRTCWQQGAWNELVALSQDDICDAEGRERIAILIAAGHAQCGQMDLAQSFSRLALSWGCSRDTVARVMLSAAYNSLACAAFGLKDEDASMSHFETSLRLVEPQAQISLLSRTRRVRELLLRGLLPDAARLLEQEFRIVRQDPVSYSARLKIMESDISLLKHELQIALRRQQIYSRNAPHADTLEARATSQLGQEIWVLERLGHKSNGFFVEFGATDGVTLSNSWLLETEFGWEGLCAEPNPKFFDKLCKNRKCQTSPACIAGRSGEKVEFVLADAFGGIAEYADADMHKETRSAYIEEGNIIHLETVSLDDFLTQHNAPRDIDYMSVDTEGSEYDILSHFPFDKWNVQLLTVEHNYTPMRQKIRQLMEDNGYQCTERQFDDWYEKVC